MRRRDGVVSDGRRMLKATSRRVVAQQSVDVVVREARDAVQRPVLADLRQPPHAPALLLLSVVGYHQLVEVVRLAGIFVAVAAVAAVSGLRVFSLAPVLGANAPPQRAQASHAMADARGEQCGDLAPYARGHLAPAARGGDADVEGPVGVHGEEREGRE